MIDTLRVTYRNSLARARARVDHFSRISTCTDIVDVSKTSRNNTHRDKTLLE